MATAIRAIKVPVVVVGAGPTGLAASLFLHRRGIRHVVLERRGDLHLAPQAHVLKTRTIEIYRKLGLDGAILDRATPVGDTRYINWFVRLTAPPLASLDLQHIRTGAATRDLSPVRAANLPQDQLEAILHGAAKDAGADIRFSTEVTSVENFRAFSVVMARDHITGTPIAFETDYVLAADGASSTVRRRLGIEMDGRTAIASFVAIYFRSDLSAFFKERPGLVNWGLAPGARGTLIVHGVRDRSVFMYEYDPAQESLEDYPHERCEALIRRVIGDPGHVFEIRSIGGWTMTAQVAERYSQGRTFLIGDAAHRFPPTGGLGLNTGAQDVFNLIWKLDLVLRGKAGPELLQTYEAECRPVALANCAQSLKNQLRNNEVQAALGLTGETALDSTKLEAALSETTDGQQRRDAADAAARGQTPHYVSLGLDLGFAYSSAAIIGDDSEPVPQETMVYTPNCRPGARLPHCWLTAGSERVSTLDLASDGVFTLFAGHSADHWQDAADKVGREFGVTVCLVPVGPGERLEDPSGRWADIRGHGAGGAILVRPDGHVAWRTQGGTPEDLAAGVMAAMSRILARTSASISHAY